MINIDMWYGDNHKECDKITIFFNDVDYMYWGNIYKNGKCIGDYSTNNSIEIERTFNHLCINWN